MEYCQKTTGFRGGEWLAAVMHESHGARLVRAGFYSLSPYHFSPHFNYQKENLYLCYPDIRTQAITSIYLITGKKFEVYSE